MRKFEIVKQECRKFPLSYIKLPERGTKHAMAYDFYSPAKFVAQPGEVIKVWTDVKAAMNPDECLLINIRSSMGGTWELVNQQGWIDSDYYSNPDNDGNIMIKLRNVSDVEQSIYQGDRVGQGVFMKYLITDDDNATTERTGGFGSTGK